MENETSSMRTASGTEFIQVSESLITEGLAFDSHVPFAHAYTLMLKVIFPGWAGNQQAQTSWSTRTAN